MQTNPSLNRSELAENVDYLRQLSPFERTPFEIIRLYAYIAKRSHYRQGDFIFHQGERAGHAYVILSGEVTLLLEKEGRTVVLQTLGRMGFFGYMSLLAGYDWSLNARAASATEILSMDREGFRKILVRFPDQCLDVVESLVQLRMQRMQEHMDTLMKTIRNQDDRTKLEGSLGI